MLNEEARPAGGLAGAGVEMAGGPSTRVPLADPSRNPPHPTPGPQGCPTGLYWPDGIRRCWHHTDAPGRALLADLDRRAARVGVPREPVVFTHGPGRAWPYGPDSVVAMRQGMVEWAELRGVSYAPHAHACPSWLRTGRCRNHDHDRPAWADHLTAWKRGGQPTLLLAHPYGFSDQAVVELVELAGDPHLFVDVDPANGWYGGGTRPVAVWRRADAPTIARPPVPDPWCMNHGRPDPANRCPNPAHPDGCPWGGSAHAVNRCEECARLAARGRRQRRPWTGPTGHEPSDCLHCEVCDVCKGSGRVCRDCGRCDAHELSTRQCPPTVHCGRCVFCTTSGNRYCGECPGCAERSRATVAQCVQTRPSTLTRRDPVTGRWYRPELTYFEHSTYDKVTGRWSE